MTGLEARFSQQRRGPLEKTVLAAAEKLSRDIGYQGDIFNQFQSVR